MIIKKQYIMGIDPGLSGGIVLLDLEKKEIKETRVMPSLGGQLDVSTLSTYISECSLQVGCAVMEKVHAMPGQGVSSMFKFGQVYGMTEALLVSYKIPYVLVPPQRWTKQMHAGILSKMKPKAKSLLVAQRLFPQVNFLATRNSRKVHDGIIDAALLAEYGRRTFAYLSH